MVPTAFSVYPAPYYPPAVPQYTPRIPTSASTPASHVQPKSPSGTLCTSSRTLFVFVSYHGPRVWGPPSPVGSLSPPAPWPPVLSCRGWSVSQASPFPSAVSKPLAGGCHLLPRALWESLGFQGPHMPLTARSQRCLLLPEVPQKASLARFRPAWFVLSEWRSSALASAGHAAAARSALRVR